MRFSDSRRIEPVRTRLIDTVKPRGRLTTEGLRLLKLTHPLPTPRTIALQVRTQPITLRTMKHRSQLTNLPTCSHRSPIIRRLLPNLQRRATTNRPLVPEKRPPPKREDWAVHTRAAFFFSDTQGSTPWNFKNWPAHCAPSRWVRWV